MAKKQFLLLPRKIATTRAGKTSSAQWARLFAKRLDAERTEEDTVLPLVGDRMGLSLKEYVGLQKGLQAKLSRCLGLRGGLISDWVYGKKPIPTWARIRLRKITQGQIE